MQSATIATVLLSLVSVSVSGEAYSRAVSVKTLMRTGSTSSGARLSLPAGDSSEVTGLEVTIPAGKTTGWHKHLHSGFGYVLSGRLQVVLADSTRHEYGPGEAFAEVVGILHEGRALGEQDVRLVAFFLSDPGKPVSIKP